MIIYSDDPRGIKEALRQEREKDPSASIQLKKAKEKPAAQKKPIYKLKDKKSEIDLEAGE